MQFRRIAMYSNLVTEGKSAWRIYAAEEEEWSRDNLIIFIPKKGALDIGFYTD